MKNILRCILLIISGGISFADLPTVALQFRSIPPSAPIGVQAGSGLNFSIERSFDLSSWHPYIDVFTRVSHLWFNVFDRSPDAESTPTQFYHGAELPQTPSEMLAKWQAKGISHYRFDFKRVCGCSPGVLTGSVTVQDGEVVSVENIQPSTAALDDFKSVEQMFDIFISQVQAADLLTIRYDPDLLFPQWLEINPNYDVADDDVEYHVESLVVLP